jgi:putative acetyltransferase
VALALGLAPRKQPVQGSRACRGVQVRPLRPADVAAVCRLWSGYAWEFRSELGPQDLEAEGARLPEPYTRPGWGAWVAEHGGRVVGCAFLKPLDADTAELKRMVVAPEARGLGAGRALGEAVLSAARVNGHHRVVLDTVPGMRAARALYASLGFAACAPYYAGSPLVEPLFMERRL